MADRRSQSDESLIVEYFTMQPLAACDALLNQIADQLRKRRPKRVESDNNTKPAIEPERKPSQKRKAGKEVTACGYKGCKLGPNENVHHMYEHPHYHPFQGDGVCANEWCKQSLDHNVHQLKTQVGYHEFVEPAGEASKGAGA